jgi:hypothetical protein
MKNDMKTSAATISGHQAIRAGWALLAATWALTALAPAAKAAEAAAPANTAVQGSAVLFTPAQAPQAQLSLAPSRIAVDPDVAILGANGLRCAPVSAAVDQMDRLISERVAQSRDSFLVAQARRDMALIEMNLRASGQWKVASAH